MSGNPKIGPEDVNVVIKFGGGLHTRASPDEIDPREAYDGANFLIDLENKNLRNRKPFDKIGAAPNGLAIRGGFSLLKADGTVKTAFQAGDKVYEWDGETTFTQIGTCSSSAKLRGHWWSHNWALDDKVLITDLSLAETVKEWDGSTFQSVAFTNEAGSGFGNFSAKYCSVSNERAIFLNTKDPGATTPHLMVGSERSDYTVITVNQRPSSSLSDADPFFLLTPDLRPINGHVGAFQTNIISTEKGQLFNLAGQTSQDYNFEDFYPGSGASGSEALLYIGNDVVYGRQGRIESLTGTNSFGNSQADDITAKIANVIETYSGWTGAFNSRLGRLYMLPSDVSEMWVLDTAVRQAGQISPWMRWQTDHTLGFQPTFIDSMLDPNDGLEYVFMGDASGNIYRLEGRGADGDGGTTAIHLSYLTKLFSVRLDAKAYNVEGYVKYAKNQAATVNLTFRYQGQEIFDKSISIDLPEVMGANYYGGDAYYGGEFFYGTLEGRLARQTITPPGDANEFQLQLDVFSNSDISINEIGLRFRAAS